MRTGFERDFDRAGRIDGNRPPVDGQFGVTAVGLGPVVIAAGGSALAAGDAPGLAAALPPFGPAEVTLDGDRVRLVGDDGVALAHRLTAWALDHRVELTGFTVSQPSLEDIYLSLTHDLVDARVATNQENHR